MNSILAIFAKRDVSSESRDSHGKWAKGSGTTVRVPGVPEGTLGYPEEWSGSGDHNDSGRFLDHLETTTGLDTPEEQKALWYYSHQGDEWINSHLRYDNGNSRSGDAIKSIDKVMERSHTPQSIIVYRGLSSDSHLGTAEPGTEFSDKGYQSTTLHAYLAEGFVKVHQEEDAPITMLRITVPKGTKAVAMTANRSMYDQERELLLDRSTTLRIDKVTQKGDMKIVHCTVVKQGPYE